MSTKKDVEQVQKVQQFSKDSLLQSKFFSNQKDILGAVIKDGEKVTIEEAQSRIDKFMKGKVK